MRVLNLFNARRCRQVKTKPEVDNRTDNRRGRDIRSPRSVLKFNREFQASAWIGFPEIDSGTEPVVIVRAFLKGFASEKPFGDGLVAPVVSENESRRQAVQFLPESFG